MQRPSARTVCEMSLAKTPARIHHMRPDALALLLTLANIGPHAKVLPRLQLGTHVLSGCLARDQACKGSSSVLVAQQWCVCLMRLPQGVRQSKCGMHASDKAAAQRVMLQNCPDVSCELILCHLSIVARHEAGVQPFYTDAQACGAVLAADLPGRGQVLLVDQTSGLVAGSCAERMGGHGTIVLAHTGDRQLFPIQCSDTAITLALVHFFFFFFFSFFFFFLFFFLLAWSHGTQTASHSIWDAAARVEG